MEDVFPHGFAALQIDKCDECVCARATSLHQRAESLFRFFLLISRVCPVSASVLAHFLRL